MLCSNCGKNEANVHYTRIINGEKTEYNVCEDCAKKIGIDEIDFNMPISFSNFLSDFFEEDAMLPSFSTQHQNKCPKCGLTYEEFAESGRLGCGECYHTFSNKIDAVLKNLHGTSKHRGRALSNYTSEKCIIEDESNKEEKATDSTKNKKELLNKQLQLAIKEERYEDAAKIRDEIKKVQ